MDFLTNCIFFGKEVEGEQVGKPTLFVAEPKVTKEKLQAAIKEAESQGIKRIYFGAGKTHQFPLFVLAENDGPTDLLVMLPKDWEYVVELTPNNLIALTVALDNAKDFLELFFVILDLSEFPDMVTGIKCEMYDRVYLWNLKGAYAYISTLDNELYKEDTIYGGPQTS